MADLTTAAGALAAVNDRSTSEDDLATIVADYPDLRYLVAAHPNAYPELLDWLWQYGGDDARRMISRRSDEASSTTQTAAPAPTVVRAPASVQASRTPKPSPVAEPPVEDDAPRHRTGLLAGIGLILIALILAAVFFGVPGTAFKGVLEGFKPKQATPSAQVTTSPTVPTTAPVATSAGPAATSTGPVATSTGPVATSSSAAPSSSTPATSASPASYAKYSNPRFGFTVDYPTALTADPAPANGDGQSWSSTRGNVTFTATGINNTSGDSKQQVTSDLVSIKPAGAKVTYQDGGQGAGYYWGVVSGTSAGGSRSFYTYEAIGAGSGVRLTWAWDTSATYVQDWVTHCYGSLKPGDRTQAH